MEVEEIVEQIYLNRHPEEKIFRKVINNIITEYSNNKIIFRKNNIIYFSYNKEDGYMSINPKILYEIFEPLLNNKYIHPFNNNNNIFILNKLVKKYLNLEVFDFITTS
jgi:hypothetical protein